MSDIKTGDFVNVTIKSVRQVNHPSADRVRIADEHGDVFDMPAQAAIERIAPATWPPRPGDIWAGPENTRWFAAMYIGDPEVPKDFEGCNSEGWRVVLVPLEIGPYGDSEKRPDDALQTRGPLTLVHREGAQEDVEATEDVEPADATALIRQATRYLRGPVEDQAERRQCLARAAGPLAALLEREARHWDAVRVAGACAPGDEGLAVARALTGGGS